MPTVPSDAVDGANPPFGLREPWQRQEVAALVGIFIVALVLRVWQLDTLPAGAQHDEVFDSGFALSIVRGARPVFFDVNGGVPVLFMYLMAPFIGLFGRTLLVARSVAVLCGMLSLLVSYLLLRRLLGRGTALLAVAGLSISFWHLFASRTALEPITVPLVGGLAFYLLWLALENGQLAFFGLSGVCLGLSLYTYHSGPLIPLTIAVYCLYLATFHRKLLRQRFWGLALCALLALLVAMPLGYHVLNHADASTSRVRDLAGHLQAAQSGDFGPLTTDVISVVGMFGWQGDPEWRYNLAGRPVFDPLGAILFYSGFLIALARVRRPEYGFLLVWLPVNLLFSAITPPSPSTLRAIGGVAAAYAFPAVAVVALARWARARWGRRGLTSVAFLIAVWLVLAGNSLALDYFGTWANHPEVRTVYRADLAEAARYLDASDTGDTIVISAPYAADLDRQSFEMVAQRPHHLKWVDGRRAIVWPAAALGQPVELVLPSIGQLPTDLGSRFLAGLQPERTGLDPQGQPAFTVYHLDADALARRRSPAMEQTRVLTWNDQIALMGYDLVPSAPSGGTARLVLYWRVLSRLHPSDTDAPIFSIHLLDSRGELWSQDNYQAFYPSQWTQDDVVVSWFDLPIPVDAPPGRYHATVGVLAGDHLLPVHDATDPGATPRVTLGSLAVTRGLPPRGNVDLHLRFPRRFDFGPIRLLGVNGQETVRAGQEWLLSLYWLATAQPDGDCTAVLRFYGNNDEQILEWRGVLLEGAYPTSQWRPGDYVRTNLYVPIPAHLPSSKGRVRLNVVDASGRPLATDPGISVIGLAIAGQ